MCEKKRLSEVLDVTEIIKSENNKFIIISGVGSGKNYFVENILKDYGNILYISSRRAKVDEILVNKLCSTSADWESNFEDITVLTNAGIELLVKNKKFSKAFPEIMEHYDFIVVDEAHSLFNDATFTTPAFHVHTLIEYATKNYSHIKVVLMTGTPEPIPEMYLSDYTVINKMDECINVVPKRIESISREEAVKIIANMSSNEKTVYFGTFASRMVRGKKCLRKKLIESGLSENDITYCMSPKSMSNYKDDVAGLEDKVKELRESIKNTNKLPEDKKILLTTASLKEGINIQYIDDKEKDENCSVEKVIKIAFCESHLLSDIQQFAGRIRDGLDVLYIIDDSKQHTITDEELKKGKLEYHYNEVQLLTTINSYFDSYIRKYDSEVYTEIGYNENLILYHELFYQDYFSVYNVGSEASKFFIDFIESKNRYIKYNHVGNRFDLYENKLTEEARINKKLNNDLWETEIDTFAKEYNIEYVSLPMRNKLLADELRKLLESHTEPNRLYGDDRDTFRNILRDKLNLKPNSNDTTINKSLDALCVGYHLIVKSTTVNGKSKKYLIAEKNSTKVNYLSAKELKYYIYVNNKIPFILESIGNHAIKYKSQKGYYTCANWNGDNETAVNVYNNKWLNVKNWTRELEFPKYSDIFTLVQYNRQCDFKESLKYLHVILGLSDEKIKGMDFSRMVDDDEDDNDLEIYEELTPIDEGILNQYTPMLHIDWYREGIMPWTRKKFGLRYSYQEQRVVIPIRKWDDGQLVALNKRTMIKDWEMLGFQKYVLSKGYRKSLNVYGLWENKETIKEVGYAVIYEAEKSTLKRHSRNDGTGVSIHGHNLSDEQVNILTSLDVDLIVSMDADVPIDEVKFMCKKLYEKNKGKVYYTVDNYGLMGAKDSIADLTKKDYDLIFSEKVLFDENELKLLKEEMGWE